MELIDLNQQHAHNVTRTRHALGVLLASACTRHGLNGDDALMLDDREAWALIMSELEHDLPFIPQSIASDVLNSGA